MVTGRQNEASKQPQSGVLPRSFYVRDPRTVARDLLGRMLVRSYGGTILSGMIMEAEAYLGRGDSASHAFRGETPRNRVMFGEAGHAYVYVVYGLHRMLNVVTGPRGTPSAVLVRAVEPIDGLDIMRSLRKRRAGLTNGPGKLCAAMSIEPEMNSLDLTRGTELWLEWGWTIPESHVRRGRRVGVDYAWPADRDAEWRYGVVD